MVATRQDNMSHYSNNNSSALDLDDVQTPARYIALFSIFLLFFNFELCIFVSPSKLASVYLLSLLPRGLLPFYRGIQLQEDE